MPASAAGKRRLGARGRYIRVWDESIVARVVRRFVRSADFYGGEVSIKSVVEYE